MVDNLIIDHTTINKQRCLTDRNTLVIDELVNVMQNGSAISKSSRSICSWGLPVMIDNWFPCAYKVSLNVGPLIISWAVKLREHSDSFWRKPHFVHCPRRSFLVFFSTFELQFLAIYWYADVKEFTAITSTSLLHCIRIHLVRLRHQ